jgi:hypothetical protein
VQFKALVCVTIDDKSYLLEDTTLSCSSDSFKTFRLYNILLVLLYQLVFASFFVLLFRVRRALNPPFAPTVALLLRDRDESVASLRFLFRDYLPNFWYWEILDMYRRQLFICIIPLFRSSASRTILGVAVSLMSVSVVRETSPYRNGFNNTLAWITQVRVRSSIPLD